MMDRRARELQRTIRRWRMDLNECPLLDHCLPPPWLDMPTVNLTHSDLDASDVDDDSDASDTSSGEDLEDVDEAERMQEVEEALYQELYHDE